MSKKLPAPIPRLTVITLGVSDMRASIASTKHSALRENFAPPAKRLRFFDTGGTVLGLFPWDQLAQDSRCPITRGASLSRHDAGLELPLDRRSRCRA